MLYLITDLSFVGYTAGNWWFYDVWEENFVLHYEIVDSVVGNDTWDGSGSRCSFSSPVDRATFHMWTYMSVYMDVTYAYYDGTYLVDLVESTRHSPFLGVGIRTLKFPLTVGDTWQAIDTCIYALGQRIPHPNGSIDDDTIVDTLWYDTSYAYLESYTGDTIIVRFSPIKVYEKATFTIPYGDTAFLCCINNYRYIYGYIKYVVGFGMYKLQMDSMVLYQSWGIVDTTSTPWDTTFFPPTYMLTTPYYAVWTYVPVGISEKPIRGRHSSFGINGRVLTVTDDTEVYSIDGRLVKRLRAGDSFRLRPGIYFIRFKGTIRKVVVR